MTSQPKSVEEIAKKILLGMGMWDNSQECIKDTKVIAEALTTAILDEREANLEAINKLRFGGNYKDCPAAWINACADKFEKAIRSRSEHKQEGL